MPWFGCAPADQMNVPDFVADKINCPVAHVQGEVYLCVFMSLVKLDRNRQCGQEAHARPLARMEKIVFRCAVAMVWMCSGGSDSCPSFCGGSN